MCGGGALVARSVEVVMSSPDNCYTSEFTVRAFPELDGTVIECSLSSGFREVGSSSLIVAGKCVFLFQNSMSDLRMVFKKLYFVAYHTNKINL